MSTIRRNFWRYSLSKPVLCLASGFILLVVIVAILAYPLATDSSPYANTMHPAVAAQSPGFSHYFLLVPKKERPEPEPWYKAWWSGSPNPYLEIPATEIFIKNGQIGILQRIDEAVHDTSYFSPATWSAEKAFPVSNNLQADWISEYYWTNKTFILGTDKYGRDIYSRLIIGTRVSLSVGLISLVLSLSIGCFLGLIAGYYGGWIDYLIQGIIQVFWAIPTLLLVLALTLTLGKGFWQIFIAIGLTMWVSTARLVRGQVLSLKETDYIKAAKTLGLPDRHILLKEILPNITGPILVISAGNFASAILIEAGLSFLGIGIQPPQPSWGLMIKEHYNFLLANRAFLAFIPGIAIMSLVFAFNILGNGLRDFLDVKGQH